MRGRITSKGVALLLAVVLGSGQALKVPAQPAPQVVGPLTVTSVADVDYGGEIVQITVSQPVVGGCSASYAYGIRDANIIKGALALATTALLSGQTINLYVTGSCDTAGIPLVAAITVN